MYINFYNFRAFLVNVQVNRQYFALQNSLTYADWPSEGKGLAGYQVAGGIGGQGFVGHQNREHGNA